MIFMDIIVRLKTGFFEKTAYRLRLGANGLILIPDKGESAERIVIDRKDIRSVTMTERKHPELEIQTRGAVYVGIIEGGCSFGEAVSYLNENLNVKITCEYKGEE